MQGYNVICARIALLDCHVSVSQLLKGVIICRDIVQFGLTCYLDSRLMEKFLELFLCRIITCIHVLSLFFKNTKLVQVDLY